jgi:hypothetical protein
MASKFRKTWGTQTEIGRHFNLSAIAVGKLLTSSGLRDATTKQPTDTALGEGFATSTPLRDGTPFFMWNRVKIGELLRASGAEKATPTEEGVTRVYSEMRRYLTKQWEDDKMERLAWQASDNVFDDTLDEIDKKIRSEVRKIVIARLVSEKIVEDGFFSLSPGR